jgi:biopolymer transport protein ExbD
MAKHKSLRHKPSIDMTPMVDLGFLLVTFFMMTTVFSPAEFTAVSAPHATSQNKLPESNNATVVISPDGIVYFRMDGPRHLKALGTKLNEKYKLGLTAAELDKFSTQTGYGMPLEGMKQYLNLTDAQQKNFKMPGIPCETGNNQLMDWIIYARVSNPDARIVVKGDKKTGYPVIKKVLATLTDCNATRLNLITDTEATAKNI